MSPTRDAARRPTSTSIEVSTSIATTWRRDAADAATSAPRSRCAEHRRRDAVGAPRAIVPPVVHRDDRRPASVMTGRRPSPRPSTSSNGEMPYAAMPKRTRSKRASGIRMPAELAARCSSGSVGRRAPRRPRPRHGTRPARPRRPRARRRRGATRAPRDAHVPGLLGLERRGDERRPVLGARAVAVQPGVDLEMHDGGRRRPAASDRVELQRAETPSSMSASIAGAEVGLARRGARRTAAPSTPASRSASPAGTSSTASESAPASSAGLGERQHPVPVGVRLDGEHALRAGATSSASVRTLWRNASRSRIERRAGGHARHPRRCGGRGRRSDRAGARSGGGRPSRARSARRVPGRRTARRRSPSSGTSSPQSTTNWSIATRPTSGWMPTPTLHGRAVRRERAARRRRSRGRRARGSWARRCGSCSRTRRRRPAPTCLTATTSPTRVSTGRAAARVEAVGGGPIGVGLAAASRSDVPSRVTDAASARHRVSSGDDDDGDPASSSAPGHGRGPWPYASARASSGRVGERGRAAKALRGECVEVDVSVPAHTVAAASSSLARER